MYRVTGNVPTLTGLNIADNEIEYPPKTVLQQGTQEILKYLRLELQNDSQLLPGIFCFVITDNIVQTFHFVGSHSYRLLIRYFGVVSVNLVTRHVFYCQAETLDKIRF